jgi:Family of unknown function (DUF6159)
MNRIRNSWELVKASWAVLRADKELIVFPIVSTIGAIIVTLTFAIPMIISGLFAGLSDGRGGSQITVTFFAFLFYLVQYTVIFYCNSALVGAAMIRLKGGDPTVRDGFRIASQHVGAIIGYALIASTVGMVLRWLSGKGLLGRIVASLFGLAWNIATFLSVPVLVMENVGPIDAVKRSTQLLKKTWGEQIAGNLGIGVVFGLIVLLLFLIFIPVIVVAASTGSAAIIIAVILMFVLAIMIVSLIGSALNGIYTAAVYRFAAEGNAGTYFEAGLVENAFRTK